APGRPFGAGDCAGHVRRRAHRGLDLSRPGPGILARDGAHSRAGGLTGRAQAFPRHREAFGEARPGDEGKAGWLCRFIRLPTWDRCTIRSTTWTGRWRFTGTFSAFA